MAMLPAVQKIEEHPVLDRQQIEGSPALAQSWYYILELAPGLYTDGKERPNVALTRELLAKTEIEPGTRCLDIGIMEGLVSTLLERRGADVVAYDRIYHEERLNLAREALGTKFELIGEPMRGGKEPGVGMPLNRLPAALATRGHAAFDVVVFSGVLYHVYDPLAALSVVRGLVRNGGMVIIETAAKFDAELSLHLNAASRFTALSIWLPSLGVLDYMLRLVRLQPVEVAYFGGKRGRIAIACRAVTEPPGAENDEWITSSMNDFELAEYFDWGAVQTDAPPVPYSGGDTTVDLVETVRDTAPLRPLPERKRLDLGATI